MLLTVGVDSLVGYVRMALEVLWWRDGGVSRRVVHNPINLGGIASRCKLESESHVLVAGIAALDDGVADRVRRIVHNVDALLHLLSRALRADSCEAFNYVTGDQFSYNSHSKRIRNSISRE